MAVKFQLDHDSFVEYEIIYSMNKVIYLRMDTNCARV